MAHPITLFYVYADTDEELRQQLEKHLVLLQRQGVLASWQQEREQRFNEASLILLLVSADFVASDVCYQEQMVGHLPTGAAMCETIWEVIGG